MTDIEYVQGGGAVPAHTSLSCPRVGDMHVVPTGRARSGAMIQWSHENSAMAGRATAGTPAETC